MSNTNIATKALSEGLQGRVDVPPTSDTTKTACPATDPEDGPRKELTAYQAEFLKTIPRKYHQLYTRAHTTTSLRDAADAMCRDCNGWEDAANRTRECHIESCPLWSHRRVGLWRARREENTEMKGAEIG